MTLEQRRALEQQLWNIANTLRGKMDADDFRDYILGFIFYKYLSEKMLNKADALLEPEGITYTDIQENTAEGQAYLEEMKANVLEDLGYFLKPSELFSALAERGKTAGEDESTFILDDLTQILANIEKSTTGSNSEDDFDGLFYQLDLNDKKLGNSANARNKVVGQILGHLNAIDFALTDTESDLLGDAYEYLIAQFASGAGKKAGEFYTPQQVSKILAKVVTRGKHRLKSVYDPTCGSGSLLLRVAKEVDQVGQFYGQELNRTTYNLARMNMIMHDVHYAKFDIRQEDTLEYPQHTETTFEAIVANPPFSAKWSASPILQSDDRFSGYGKMAPSSKADYAFIQHMLHSLAENGTMAVVMPHGVLFRGAAEGHIRKYIIEEMNALDAVIGLPANIFYGTSIPTCILVFKKCRENPKDILFIDASQGFHRGKNQNALGDEHVDAIIDALATRQNQDKFAHVATMDEIKENDFNLNIPRYVDTFEEEDPIDLAAVTAELKRLDASMAPIDAQIADFCQELGLENPFGKASA